MDRVIKRVAPKLEEIHEPPVLWCGYCGVGAVVGWDMADRLGYEENKPCPDCGNQIELHEQIWTYHERGYVVIRCDCGISIECDDGFLNNCLRCGRNYDGNGNLLAPIEQWGEETGESAADIIGPL